MSVRRPSGRILLNLCIALLFGPLALVPNPARAQACEPGSSASADALDPRDTQAAASPGTNSTALDPAATALDRDLAAFRADVQDLPQPTPKQALTRALETGAELVERTAATASARIRHALHLARSFSLLSRKADVDSAAAARTHAATLYLDVVRRPEAAGASPREEPSERERLWAEGELARLYLEAGRVEEALRLARRAHARALHGDDPLARFEFGRTLALALDASGDRNGAIELLRPTARLGESLRRDRLGAGLDANARGAHARASAHRQAEDARFADTLRRLLSMLLDSVEAAPPGERQTLLAEVRDLLETQRSAELEDYFQDRCLVGNATSTPESIPGALILYPILLEDRVAILTGFEGRLDYHRAPITTRALLDHTRNLRQLLEKRTTRQYLRPAGHLYDALIRPIEQQVESASTDVVVVVPDGLLRTIPFAALYDRDRGRYLIDLVPVALIPSLRLTDPRPLDREKLNVLAAGLAESVGGFERLDYTRSEVSSLADLFPSRVLFDSEFRIARLEREIRTRPYSIVHVATHGRFEGDGSESFLLTHDGRLGIERMARLISTTRYRQEKPLELLALSACETAAGDDRAALGLAGIAIRSGARSALATLWPVNDEATSDLIGTFYGELAKPGQSRAGALRAAQRQLREEPRFAHPGYWAPFLMISNWL